ncbi:MAG: NEW3 domain-containing protein, partial [Dehalococcoidales bacterium]
MKIVRIICLLVISLLALAPVGAVMAQEDPEPEQISAEEFEYGLELTPLLERYDTIIVAGRDKSVSFYLANTGNGTINNITFSVEGPRDWDVEFEQKLVETLGVGETGRVDIDLAVPEQTTPGDYMLMLNVAGDEAAATQVDIRVTVNSGFKDPKIELRQLYPTLEAIAGEEFVFEVEFLYTGATMTDEPRIFNLVTEVPQGWNIHMTPPYEKEKKLTAISLKPGFTFTDKTRVVSMPPFLPLPVPGEYYIILEVVDAETGELSATVEYTA